MKDKKQTEYSVEAIGRVDMEKIYNKLVRDNIPDIIRSDNETPVTRILTEAEYERELYRKLAEECKEVYRAEDNDEACKELADVLEVIRAIANIKGKSLEDIIKLAEDKRNKRGGFSKRVYLEKSIKKEEIER